MIRSHKVFERARSEMDITIAFEAIIGGSNPSGRIVRVFDKYWLVKWRCRDDLLGRPKESILIETPEGVVSTLKA